MGDVLRPWCPLRRVGGTQVFFCITSLFAFVVIFPFVWWELEAARKHYANVTTSFDSINLTDSDHDIIYNNSSRHKRSISESQQFLLSEGQHIFSSNIWWRYADYVAKAKNKSNCYVCSRMPVSSQQPRVRVSGPLTTTEACFISMASRGYYGLYEDRMNSTECQKRHTMTRFSGNSSSTSDFIIHADYSSTIQFTSCYSRNGSRPVGSIPSNRCAYTFIGGYITWDSDIFIPTNPADCPPGRTCVTVGMVMMPQANGTYTVEEGWWLCGHAVYASLPPFWSGVCAPVRVTDDTVIISEVSTSTRSKRGTHPDFEPHDSVYGSNVPDEYKHASVGKKVLWGLFPWVGTAKNTLRLETIDYRFKSFVNSTLLAVNGIREELTSMRLMIMQNRMVLDQLTAEQGGVCAIVGEHCCTFIPENDADGHIIHQAILNMTELQDTMSRDGTPIPDFLTRLWFTWKGILIQATILLLAFVVFVTCIIPMLRNMVTNLVSTHMVQYTPVSDKDNGDDHPDLFHIPDYEDSTSSDSDSDSEQSKMTMV